MTASMQFALNKKNSIKFIFDINEIKELVEIQDTKWPQSLQILQLDN